MCMMLATMNNSVTMHRFRVRASGMERQPWHILSVCMLYDEKIDAPPPLGGLQKGGGAVTGSTADERSLIPEYAVGNGQAHRLPNGAGSAMGVQFKKASENTHLESDRLPRDGSDLLRHGFGYKFASYIDLVEPSVHPENLPPAI